MTRFSYPTPDKIKVKAQDWIQAAREVGAITLAVTITAAAIIGILTFLLFYPKIGLTLIFTALLVWWIKATACYTAARREWEETQAAKNSHKES
jgi:hypothetical protein